MLPESFAADWLSLREPADHTARDPALIAHLLEHLPLSRRLRIVDLGAGSGSNLRYLASRIPAAQDWVLVDHDVDLLARAEAEINGANPSLSLSTQCQDLSRWPLPIDGADLVTASALLDLVNEAWLAQLAQACAAKAVPLLLALSIDGRIELAPEHPVDTLLFATLGEHQRSEKGMGAALGPDAIDCASRHLEQHGFRLLTRTSDWRLDGGQAGLQRELFAGWHAAACAQRPAMRKDFDAWLAARLRSIPDNRVVVGHRDILALP